MRKGWAGAAGKVLALVSALAPGPISAHPAQPVTLQVTVEPTGKFRANLNLDVLAYALGKPSIDASNEELEALLDGPRAALAQDLADADAKFRREVVVRTNAGDAVTVQWELPGLAEIDAVLARHIMPRILIVGDIAFFGALPGGARTISVRLPYTLGDAVHVYAVPGGAGEGQLVPAGEFANVIKFSLPPAEAPVRGLAVWRVLAGGLAAMAAAFLAIRWISRRSWHRRGMVVLR